MFSLIRLLITFSLNVRYLLVMVLKVKYSFLMIIKVLSIDLIYSDRGSVLIHISWYELYYNEMSNRELHNIWLNCT